MLDLLVAHHDGKTLLMKTSRVLLPEGEHLDLPKELLYRHTTQ